MSVVHVASCYWLCIQYSRPALMPTESRTKNLAPHSLEVGGSGYGFGITAGGADRNSGGQIAGGRGTYSSLSLLNNLSLFQSASASTSLACNSDQSFRL